VEFKFPVNWFKPPFTEFVLVSKEELSDDEWKIVFDPLVKKGVSDIEATIKSDTQFELLNTGSYGYESDDDDDYLPDSLREEEIIEEVVEVPKPTFTPSENQKSLLKILNKAFNDRGWNEIGLRPTTFQWIMDKAKFDGITRRRPEFRKLLASLRDANMITIEKFEGWKEGDAIYSPIEMIEEKEDERLGRIKHTDKFEEFVALNPSIFNAETFEADSKEESRLKKYEKTYGKEGAKVRNRIFKRIIAKAQDGTKAGQWSARKAQSLAEDYEKAMGKKGKKPYKSSKKTKSQKSLKDWGDQDWKTKSGKKSSKTGERYLPAKAIDSLTDKEYNKTSAKKRKDMKKGKQFSDQPKKIADKVAKYRAETFESEYTFLLYVKEGTEGYGEHGMYHGITDEIPPNATIEEIVESIVQVAIDSKAIKSFQDIEFLGIENPDEERIYEYDTDPEEGDLKVWFAEGESSKPHSVTISRSSNSEKKLMAVFEDSEGKKIKTTHFGQRGASDYTKHGEKERMERYLERHGGGFETSTKENWKDPTTAGALSRWILWNKPSLNASFDDYKSRFGLKGSIEVSKSAESLEAKNYFHIFKKGRFPRVGSISGFYSPYDDANKNYPQKEIIDLGSDRAVLKEQFKEIPKKLMFWKMGDRPKMNERGELDFRYNNMTESAFFEMITKKNLATEERKCKSCEKPATTVVQEGSFCYECLPINLGAENESKFPAFQFVGSVLLVTLLPLFLDNRRDKV